MKKLLLILLAFTVNITLVYASAKIIMPIKKEIRLSADSGFETADYNWVLISKDGEILDTQNSSIYTQKFSKAGEYILNLTSTDKQSGIMKSTKTILIIGKSSKFFQGMNLEIDTIPPIDKDGEISFSGSSGTVSFFFADSEGVQEFNIDKDINLDTNKDKDPANDIDNKESPSFNDGSLFAINYSGNRNITAQVTFIGYNEEIEKRDFKIVFNKRVQSQYDGKLKAVLKTLPKYNLESKEIYVPFGINEVYLYSKESIGDFLQYRIDEDISIDSDGDSKPDNDIDNTNSTSFQDGDIYSIKRSDKESQTVQLLIVSGNKGSAIRRKIAWGKENQNKILAIYSSSEEALIDSDVIFGISGLDESEIYEIEWDFNGDGKIDKKDSKYAKYSYDDPGIFNVQVRILNQTGTLIGELSKSIEIREEIENEIKTKQPISDFTFSINGPYVKFTQNTSIDPQILNKGYSSFWKFGDGNISTEQNPEFIYASTGIFVIELNVTDSHSKMSTIKKELSINNLGLKAWPDASTNNTGSIGVDNFDNDNEEDEAIVVIPSQDTDDKGSESQVKIIGGDNILFVTLTYLGIFLGISSFLIIAYILYLKIKNPDYNFSEILEEERERILSFIEGEPYVHPASDISSKVSGGVADLLSDKNSSSDKESETSEIIDAEVDTNKKEEDDKSIDKNDDGDESNNSETDAYDVNNDEDDTADNDNQEEDTESADIVDDNTDNEITNDDNKSDNSDEEFNDDINGDEFEFDEEEDDDSENNEEEDDDSENNEEEDDDSENNEEDNDDEEFNDDINGDEFEFDEEEDADSENNEEDNDDEFDEEDKSLDKGSNNKDTDHKDTLTNEIPMPPPPPPPPPFPIDPVIPTPEPLASSPNLDLPYENESGNESKIENNPLQNQAEEKEVTPKLEEKVTPKLEKEVTPKLEEKLDSVDKSNSVDEENEDSSIPDWLK